MSPEQVADSRAMQDMEDWLADTLQDSVDMDWSTTDGAKAIVRHWEESPVAAEITRLQALVEQLADLLAASRMGLSVLLDTADDFTEVDRQNCEQARDLIGRIDTTLSTAKGADHGG